MTANNFSFTPADGLRNAVSFPTSPASEADARNQPQTLLDQLRDYINTTIVAAINAKLDLSGGNLTGALASNSTLTGTALIASGLTGATAASRNAGATTSGAPASGTFAKGDFVIDQAGLIWICTTAGTPGTWTKVGGTSAAIISGSYTGDGTTSRTINVGFTPKLLYWSTLNDTPTAGGVALVGYGANALTMMDNANANTGVSSLDSTSADSVYIAANGFTVKSSNITNLTGKTYGYVAIG